MLIRHICKILVALIIAFPLLAKSQIQIATGPCSTNVSNIGANSTVEIVNNVCGDSLRIRYLWLDGETMSIINEGISTDETDKVIGDKTSLLKFGAYDTLKKIMELGSERVTPNSFDFISTSASSAGQRDTISSSSRVVDKLEDGGALYYGDDPIIWPDYNSYSEFYDESQWPSNQSYCYIDKYSWSYESFLDQWSDAVDSQKFGSVFDTIARDINFHGGVPKSEFRAYFRSMKPFIDLLKKHKVDLEPREVPSTVKLQKKDLINATPPSYKLIDYLTKNNFPDDFLVKVGRYVVDGCAGTYGLQVYAIPRELKVLVALIEPTSPSVTITNLELKADQTKGLRNDYNLTVDLDRDVSLPTLLEGETYLLPLRIEFKNNLKFEKSDEDTAFYNAYSKISEALPDNMSPYLGSYANHIVAAAASLRGLEEPKDAMIEPVYYFDAVYGLETITTRNSITGNKIRHKIRETPKVAVLTYHGYEGGSCPFLQFEIEDQLHLHGRVLVGSSDESLKSTEQVLLPTNTSKIVLSEREPEVSFIEEIKIVSLKDGTSETLVRDMVLAPQESMTVEIPLKYRIGSELQITGYYKLLNSL